MSVYHHNNIDVNKYDVNYLLHREKKKRVRKNNSYDDLSVL